MPYATPWRIEDAKKILAELFSRLDQGDSVSTAMAQMYIGLGNKDQAFSKRPRAGGTRGFAESRFTDQSSQFLKGLGILARPKRLSGCAATAIFNCTAAASYRAEP
jgi:hypothetical protein